MHGLYTREAKHAIRVKKSGKLAWTISAIGALNSTLVYGLTESMPAALTTHGLTLVAGLLWIKEMTFYYNTPWETEAREFAEDAERFAKYGSIIMHPRPGTIHRSTQ